MELDIMVHLKVYKGKIEHTTQLKFGTNKMCNNVIKEEFSRKIHPAFQLKTKAS